MKFPNGERSCERLPLHRREDMMKEGASISFGGGGESGKGADRTLGHRDRSAGAPAAGKFAKGE